LRRSAHHPRHGIRSPCLRSCLSCWTRRTPTFSPQKSRPGRSARIPLGPRGSGTTPSTKRSASRGAASLDGVSTLGRVSLFNPTRVSLSHQYQGIERRGVLRSLPSLGLWRARASWGAEKIQHFQTPRPRRLRVGEFPGRCGWREGDGDGLRLAAHAFERDHARETTWSMASTFPARGCKPSSCPAAPRPVGVYANQPSPFHAARSTSAYVPVPAAALFAMAIVTRPRGATCLPGNYFFTSSNRRTLLSKQFELTDGPLVEISIAPTQQYGYLNLARLTRTGDSRLRRESATRHEARLWPRAGGTTAPSSSCPPPYTCASTGRTQPSSVNTPRMPASPCRDFF